MISTLHAGSCRGVWERLLVMCADRSAVSAALELVLNQRLLRRVCSACHGTGCAECLQTGYRGRVPVVEWVRLTDAMRRQLREQGPEAIQPATSLETAARQLAEQGVTNAAECERMFGRGDRIGDW
jgi:type II secretory ATPase GspE/PulE/Tfp pilus assembly ATPase PilB-like protein